MGSDRPTLLQVFSSVLAAMFGVQSQAKREFDFSRGRFSHYAIVGAMLTVVFVLLVWTVVKVVLWFADV